MRYRSIAFAATLLLGGVMIPSMGFAQDELNGGSSQDTRPDGRGNRTHQTPARNGAGASGNAVVTGNGINYHGGPVMHGPVNVYFIWYGDWTKDSSANQILTDWAHNIGSSPYENINTTYGDTTENVSGVITYATSISIPSTAFGTSLSDSNIASIVSDAFSLGLPTDSNGVYFVLTAPGINETSGFLTQYCGWHTYGTLSNGTYIKYAFVGDALGNSLGNCAAQTSKSPNGDPAADAMVSVMSHELEESASDPNLNAWYDSSGEENADKCAWTFGTTYAASAGGAANMHLGNSDYLIQQNWVNAGGGYCALSYSVTPDFSLSVSPTSQTLPSTGGTTGTYTITETATGGFSGTVAYTITGLPMGASATLTGSNTFTVTAASVAVGTYSFTITGTSTSPSLAHSITATLVVSGPNPDFTISASPSSQTITRGSSNTYTVTVTKVNGFNGTVNFSVNGTSSRVSARFSPSSVTGAGTSTMTVTVNRRASTGTSTLTIKGTSGSLSHSTPVTLVIN